ncbi:MAG: DNA polymerase III subunit beta [Candidatus Liberibacter ctenarytainae]|uniref:Beta sliding clamp n=1 Tax=Candidatus Liberibacter ctenarytainae TaxID=2020335 RepID=A0A937DIX0_9HYPH|nr:DNA polymerase III subunit beta [Candidatus Liberibacter ctenarytainae]
MEIIIERSEILEFLNHAYRIVERRNAVPISGHILLTAADQALKIKASGTEIEIEASIPAHVEVIGSCTVPVHLLHDIVRKLPDGSDIFLSKKNTEESRVIISSGSSKFFLQSFPEVEFPASTEEKYPYSFKIKSSTLKNLMERTHFSMATEEIRYYLNGIFFHIDESGLKLRSVATDGHRLAVAEAVMPEILGMPSIIVPRKAVGEIQRILSSKDLMVEIKISESRIHLEIESICMSSRLIDGDFPAYRNVVPDSDKNNKELRVNCNNLRQAVDRVSTIASLRSQSVKLSLSPGKLKMTVDNPDLGNAVEDLDVNYTDGPMDIGFNYKYLLEIIDNISDDQMICLLEGPNSSALIKGAGAGEGDVSAFYVLMPMRI